MRRLLFIIGFLLTVFALYGQRQKNFVGVVQFTGFSAVSGGESSGNATSFSDALNDGYNATQVQVGYRCMDAQGREYEILEIIGTPTFSTCSLRVAVLETGLIQPLGRGIIYDPKDFDLIPNPPANAAGITQVLRAWIDTHNARVLNDSLSLVAAMADTTSLSNRIDNNAQAIIDTAAQIRGDLKNIYTDDGTLTGDRVLTGDFHILDFQGLGEFKVTDADVTTISSILQTRFGGTNGESIIFDFLADITFQDVGAIQAETYGSSLIQFGRDDTDAHINASGSSAFYTIGVVPVNGNQGSAYIDPGRGFFSNYGNNNLVSPLVGLNLERGRGTFITPAAVQIGDFGQKLRWTMRDNNGALGQWVVFPETVTTPGGSGIIFSDLVFTREPTVSGSLGVGRVMTLLRNADIQFDKYLNTRNDTLTTTPINFLYTDNLGRMRSAPLTFSGIGGGGGGGGGEVNDGVNIGTGADIYAGKSGVSLQFRGLAGTNGISTSVNVDNIEIDGSSLQTDIATNAQAIIDTATQIRNDFPDVPLILSQKNVTYGSGSALKPAEWLNDSVLTFATLSPGSVIFAGNVGQLQEDNPRLFWNDAQNRLGLNTNVPSYTFDARDTTTGTNSATTTPRFDFYYRRAPSANSTGNGTFVNTQFYTDFGTAFDQDEVTNLRAWMDLNQAANFNRATGLISGIIQLTPSTAAVVDTAIGVEAYNVYDGINADFTTSVYAGHFARNSTIGKMVGTRNYLGIHGSSTITDAIGTDVIINGPSTNKYGVYVHPFTGTTSGNSYAFYSLETSPSLFTGNIGINTSDAAYSLDASGNTDGVAFAGGTDAQRPAHLAGVLRWSTTCSCFEYSDGANWIPLLPGSVSTDATLTGDGSGGSPLRIAQQGATSGQVLKWNGSTWLPQNDNSGADGNIYDNDGTIGANPRTVTAAGVNLYFQEDASDRIGMSFTTVNTPTLFIGSGPFNNSTTTLTEGLIQIDAASGSSSFQQTAVRSYLSDWEGTHRFETENLDGLLRKTTYLNGAFGAENPQDPQAAIRAHSVSTDIFPRLQLLRWNSTGGSILDREVVTSGMTLGSIDAMGARTTLVDQAGAQLRFVPSENWGTGAGTSILFSTAANGSTTLVDRFAIGNAGNLTASAYPSSRDDSGTTTPVNFLYSDGSGNFLSAPISGLGGTSYVFSNGITETVGSVVLGGTLNQPTTINGGTDYSMIFTSSRAFPSSTVQMTNSGTGIALDVNAGSGYGIDINAAGIGITSQSSGNLAGLFDRQVATTGTFDQILGIRKIVSAGVGTVGTGGWIGFNTENDAGTVVDAGRIGFRLSDVTSGSHGSDFVVNVIENATAGFAGEEELRVESDGGFYLERYKNGSTHTGTVDAYAAFDVNGKMIRTPAPAGAAQFNINDSDLLIGATANQGDRYTIKPSGAEYRVESSTVTGYNSNSADEAAVITMSGGLYAILQPENGLIPIKAFLGKNSWTDAQAAQAALDYTSALESASAVAIDSNYVFTDSLVVPENSGFIGVSNNGGFNNLTDRKAELTFNIANSSAPAIRFDANSAGGYLEGIVIKNIVVKASSAALCGILMKEPFTSDLENVLIDGTGSKFFTHGLILDGGISGYYPDINIRNTTRSGVYIMKGVDGINTTTTTTFANLYVNDTEYGIQVDSAAGAIDCFDCTLESLDSSAALSYGQSTMTFWNVWTESIGGPGVGKPIFDIGRGPANIGANRGEFTLYGGRVQGTKATEGGHLPNSAALKFNYIAKVVVDGTRFNEVGKILQLGPDDNAGIVSLENVWERAIDSTVAAPAFAGVPINARDNLSYRNVIAQDGSYTGEYYNNDFGAPSVQAALDTLVPLWRRFGINPLDTLDDYSAIAAALSYLAGKGGGTLELPEGQITTSQAILVPDSVSIVGQGYGTLVISDEPEQELGIWKGTIYTDGTGVRIANLRINGRFPVTTYLADDDSNYPARSSGIELTLDSRDCVVENIWISQVTRHGILVSGQGHHVENLVIDETNSFGISFGGQANLISAGEATSANNIVRNIKIGRSHAKECIEINDASQNILLDGFETFGNGHPAIFVHDHGNANELNFNITIQNGTIHSAGNTTPQVQVLGTSTNTHRNIFFRGIKVYSGAYGIDYQIPHQTTDNDGGPGFRINSYCSNIVIDNCWISAEEGVLINPAVNNTATKITVQNSVMFMMNDINAAGITIDDANEVVIENCTISDYYGDGILISNGVGVIIQNNRIKNNSTVGVDYGIELVGTNTDVMIDNNYLGNDNGSTWQNYGISITSGTSADLKIQNNKFDNNASGPLTGTIAATMYVRGNQGLADDYVGAQVGSFHAAITTAPSVATSGTAATLTFTSILQNSGGFSLQNSNTEVQYDGTNPHYFMCTATLNATTDVTGNFVLDLRGTSGSVVLGSQTITVLNTGDYVGFTIPIYQQLSNGGDFGFTVTGPTGNMTIRDLDLVCHQVR